MRVSVGAGGPARAPARRTSLVDGERPLQLAAGPGDDADAGAVAVVPGFLGRGVPVDLVAGGSGDEFVVALVVLGAGPVGERVDLGVAGVGAPGVGERRERL